MKERPILFSGPMVRAILEGRQTQTRRIVKDHPGCSFEIGTYHKSLTDRYGEQYPACNESFGIFGHDGSWSIECPYGTAGDRLWVREAFAFVNPLAGCELNRRPEFDGVRYKSTWTKSHSSRWKSSIHMPRWASRITLEITGVRVERLQEISEKDAKAEGVSEIVVPGIEYGPYGDPVQPLDCSATDRDRFDHLWQSIHGAESWFANPWVWVIDFRRVQQ